MKKTLLILMMLLAFTAFSQNLILTEDTVIPHDENYLIVRTNGFNLQVNGSLVVTNFIMMNKGNNATGGSITATGDIIVGSNIYFYEDNGTIKSNTGVSVGSDITGKGTITYCTFFNTGINPGQDVTIIQDCTLSTNDVEVTIRKNEPFIIYNLLGQQLRAGLYQDEKDMYSNSIEIIYFPEINYRTKMKLKRSYN